MYVIKCIFINTKKDRTYKKSNTQFNQIEKKSNTEIKFKRKYWIWKGKKEEREKRGKERKKVFDD